MKKKILSFILCFCMIFSQMPTGIISAESETKYKVTIADNIQNGSVMIAKIGETAFPDGINAAEAEADTEIVLSVTPDSDYELSAVKVMNGDTEVGVEVTKQEDGTYIFAMPAEDISVTAEFKQTYAVKVAEDITHGTVTADKAAAAEGDSVVLTVTPDEGYVLNALTWQGDNDAGPTSITVAEGVYCFAMPAEAVTLRAEFMQPAPAFAGMNSTMAGATPQGTALSGYIGSKALEWGTYYLSSNVYGSITVSGNVTLDLNGYVLNGTNGSSVILVESGGRLTLTDNNKAQKHYFTYVEHGQWVYCGENGIPGAIDFENMEGASLRSGSSIIAISGGIITGSEDGIENHAVRVLYGGSLNFNGGTIAGNAGSSGIGIDIINGSSCTISGGNIIGNYSKRYNGTAIHVLFNSNLTLNSGNIAYNSYNGTEYTEGIIRVINGSTFMMHGGSIRHNYNTGNGIVAILHDDNNYGLCNVAINGGEIVNNTAIGNGAGIYLENGTLSLGGTVKISGNKKTDGTNNNLYLPSGRVVNISGLQSGAQIGVTPQTWPASASNPVAITGTNNGDYSSYFTSDQSGYFVSNNANVLKVYPHVHSWNYTANGAVLTGTCVAPYHSGTSTTATLTINQPAHATYSDGLSAAATVDGSIPGVTNPEIKYAKKSGDDWGDPSITPPTEAGTYTASISLTGTDSITATASVTYTIAPKNIANCTIDAIGEQIYTGSGITPDVTIKDGATILTEDKDYTVEYSNNIAVGRATATITGKGNFTDSITKNFEIKPKTTALSIDAIENQTYSGSGIEPLVTVRDADGHALTKDTDYTVAYENNIKAGTAEVKITGINGYATLYANKEFTIEKRKISFTGKSDTKTYNGTEQKIEGFDIGEEGLVNGHTSNVTAQATGMVKGEYAGSISEKAAIVIKDADLNDVTSNYEIKAVTAGKLIINAITSEITITAASQSKIYDGTALTDSGYTYTKDILVSGDELTAVVEGRMTNVGTASNQVTFYKVMHGETDVTNCYTFCTSVDGTLEVTKRAVTLYSESETKVYDGTPLTKPTVYADSQKTDVDSVFASEVEGLTATGAVTNVADSPADNSITYTFKDGFTADNYEISKTEGQLTITKNGSMTISGTNYTGIYDGQTYGKAAVPSITDGTTVTYSVDGGNTWQEDFPTITNVEKLEVTAKAENSNYVTATCTYTLEVTKRSATLTSSADSKIYDSTALTNNNVDQSHFVVGEGVKCRVTGSQTYAGSSDNSFSYEADSNTDLNNYNIQTFFGKLTVNPKPVTVTADNKSKTFGEDDPELTYQMSALAGSDTLNLSISREEGNKVGHYVITVKETGTANPNYAITFVAGDFEILDPPADAVSAVLAVVVTAEVTDFSAELDAIGGSKTDMVEIVKEITDTIEKTEDNKYTFEGSDEIYDSLDACLAAVVEYSKTVILDQKEADLMEVLEDKEHQCDGTGVSSAINTACSAVSDITLPNVNQLGSTFHQGEEQVQFEKNKQTMRYTVETEMKENIANMNLMPESLQKMEESGAELQEKLSSCADSKEAENLMQEWESTKADMTVKQQTCEKGSITSTEGIPINAVLTVEEGQLDKEDASYVAELAARQEQEICGTYDIKLSGAKENGGIYQVTVALDKVILNGSYQVVHISEDGSKEVLDANCDIKGNLTFETTGFSTFTVVVKENLSVWFGLSVFIVIIALLFAVPPIMNLIRKRKEVDDQC